MQPLMRLQAKKQLKSFIEKWNIDDDFGDFNPRRTSKD